MTTRTLLVVSIVGGLFSLGMVVAANTFYSKIGTYHPVYWIHDRKKEETEPGLLKLGKLWLYNFIIAISVTGLIFVYTAFPIGGEDLIGVTEGKALIIASIIMTFSIRVCSLSSLTSNRLFDRTISFGYSFILSIYFLSFFAVCSHILENQFSTEKIVIPAIPGNEVTSIILLVIVGPILSTLFSESILAYTGVDKDNTDDYSRGGDVL